MDQWAGFGMTGGCARALDTVAIHGGELLLMGAIVL